MFRKTLISVSLGTVLVAAALPTLVSAHGGATGIVKERMDLMKDMKDSMKTLSAIFKGEAEYNADTVKKHAMLINSHAGDEMTKLFPTDSQQGHTEALPILWNEWDQFKDLADRLKVISQGLNDAAENKPSSQMPMNNTAMPMANHGAMMGQPNQMNHSGMMGMSQAATNMNSPEHLAAMPADMVFKMMADNCSSCHTRYRKEDK